MALVSDPSLEGFNSFVSLAEADAHFEGVYFGSGRKWSSITDEAERNALLTTASRKLSQLPWGGAVYADGQTLAFPRTFNYNASEYGYGPAVGGTMPAIPAWLKQATFDMAHWLMTEDERPASDMEYSMLKGMKVGPLDYQFRDGPLGLPPAVSSLLGSLGAHIIDMRTGAKPMRMVL